MKILQILPELNVGGVETGTVDFAKYLLDRGHEALVVSNGGVLVSELEKAGVKHYQLPVHKKSLWTVLKSIGQLKKIIETEKVDIVHARSRVPAWIAFFACRRTNAQLITTCHGYYSPHFFSRVMGWAKMVIVPSQVIGKHMMDHFGVPLEDIRLIPRSVDLRKFTLPHRKRTSQTPYVISIIGRITPLKGHTFFLKAMAKVVRNIPSVKVWIIGDTPAKKESYKHELEMLVKHLGLSQQVEFLGNRPDIPDLLAQTDVLVLATVTQEAFGRVILEAQAAGVPVVATSVGGVVEIIECGKTGLLVPAQDAEAMADAVLKIFKDPQLSEQLTQAARKKLHAQYTLEHMAGRTLQVYEQLQNSLNILVIKLSSVGDVVLVTASLRAIRQKFPTAKIHCLVSSCVKDVLSHCPYIDGLIIFDRNVEAEGWPGVFRFARKLRRYKFDKVIDFQNNQKSHLLALLSFPKESYGYNRKLGFLLSHSIKDTNPKIPPVQHQFRVLKMLGIEFKNEDCYLKLWPSLKDELYVQKILESEWLGNTENIVGINISASSKWPTKNWPLVSVARLCDLLSGRNIRVIITGMEKDKETAHQLLGLCKTKPAIFVGKTDILQLAVLIKKCKVFISPDSAPIHVAAAMKTPFIAFFGPTDPSRHLPPVQGRYIILKKDLPCAPCYSGQCRISTHACMKDITPDEVFKSIQTLLKENS